MVFSATNFLAGLMNNQAVFIVITALATILLFGFLIFIHEFGHYLTARLFKVTVKEFAIGMGPKIFGWVSKKTGIAYRVRALPIGGFVSMEGEDEESGDPNAFYKKAVWKRMIITAAGATMNLIFGTLLAFIYILTSSGLAAPVVHKFQEDAASSKWLKEHDVILKVDGEAVFTGQDAYYEILRRGIEPIDILVKRDGKKVLLEDVVFGKQTEQGVQFGAQDFYFPREQKTPLTVMKHTVSQMRLSVKMIYESLFDLVTGRYGFEAVSGPVGVAGEVGGALKDDLQADPEKGQSSNNLLYLSMIITINLGVMNLLPIPALDGGRLFFQLVELVFRKPIPHKYEGYIHGAGIVILMVLMALVALKDTIGLFS